MKYFIAILAAFITKNSIAQITFAPYQAITTGSFAKVVTIADLNNDGFNDVVLGTGFYFDSINDYKLFIYYQNTSGSLNLPVVYSYTPGFPEISSISVDDVNNDQLNDIVIGYGDSIGIFYQNNSGLLNPIVSYFSGNDVDGVKTGDLNNDGLNDIAVSHANSLFIRIFYQNLTGFSSTTYPEVQGGYNEIDVGDLNNDGLNDVVFMAGQFLGGIHFYIQNASGYLNLPLAYSTLPLGSNGFHGFDIGDLNNDGRNDIAASLGGNAPDSKMYLFKQDSVTGLLNNPDTLNAKDLPGPVEIADLNCDGRNEIICLHGGFNKASVYEQNSFNNYHNYNLIPIPFASVYKPQGLSIGDINNDGRMDIAIADYNFGLVLLYNETPPSDTAIVNELFSDTISTAIWTKSSYFEKLTIIDDLSSCAIQQNDSFMVTKSFKSEVIRIDSIVRKEGLLCSYLFSDTIFTSTKYKTNTVLIGTDTNYVSTTIDTVFSDQLFSEKSTNLFPVPVHDMIVLTFTNPCYTYYQNMEALIEIYNVQGARIYSQKVMTYDFPININLSNFESNLYFLKCTAEKGSLTKKIIKID